MRFLFHFRHHFHHPATLFTLFSDVVASFFNLCVSTLFQGSGDLFVNLWPFLRPKLEMSAIGNPLLSGQLPDAHVCDWWNNSMGHS